MRQVVLDSVLNKTSRSPSPNIIPHIEEQRALRNETITTFHQAVDGDDDLLVLREKTKDETEREEEEYREFLQREVGEDLADLVTVEKDLAGSREKNEAGAKRKKKKPEADKKNSKEDADQEFLVK
jgi:protein KRI1